MTCPHQISMDRTGRGKCALGLYGGKPWLGNCRDCQKAGENTPEFAAELFARGAKSHPGDRQKISGCCDDAQNY
jgi:hypothetical protein